MKPADLNAAYDALKITFGDSILGAGFENGDFVVRILPEDLTDIVLFLKSSWKFNALNDIIGLDNLNTMAEGNKRFTILYLLYRFPDPLRLRLRIDIDENDPVNTCYYLYRSADWAEREIFDMFGIVFYGHPNMKRIYMDDDFDGHPLRKDFPLAGREP